MKLHKYTVNLSASTGKKRTSRSAKTSHTPIRFFKGAENNITLSIADDKNKDISMSSYDILGTLIDPSSTVIFSKSCKAVSEDFTKYEFSLQPDKLLGVEAGFYKLSFSYADDINQLPLYVDNALNNTVSVEVVKDNYTWFVESTVIDTFNIIDSGNDISESASYKGDQHYEDTNGLHTFAFYATGFTGKVWAYGTLDADPNDNAHWFPLKLDTIEDYNTMTAKTGIEPFNVTFNLMYIKFKIDTDSGTIDKILYRR